MNNEFPHPDFGFTVTSRLAETASPSAERVEANGGQFLGRTGKPVELSGQLQAWMTLEAAARLSAED